MKKKAPQSLTERPPIVVIMGHIDHGKSTLLDYIRKTNVTAGEAGGITQHISAYEATHIAKDGSEKRITFLDTPGHEAFSRMRTRGAIVADIAILVVSAEDGVKTQTLEALASIQEAKVPYIVAINKIDKPTANLENTRNDLMKHGVYMEGHGGDVPSVAISAKTGEGVPDLLDMMLLVAEIAELTTDKNAPMEGVVIESHLDQKKGVSATLIIKNGSLKKGMFVSAGDSMAPVRIFENFAGKPIDEAVASSAVVIIGWTTLPTVGSACVSYERKTDAEEAIRAHKEHTARTKPTETAMRKEQNAEGWFSLPVVLKTDVAGSLEAIEKEIGKIKNERGSMFIAHKGVGDVSENDVKLAAASKNSIIVGFNVGISPSAQSATLRTGADIKTFDIIYKLTEWLTEELSKRVPKILTEEMTGEAKIVRIFSGTKQKQVVGGRVTTGTLNKKSQVKILRRGNEIGKGEVVELQQRKTPVMSVPAGEEFGAMISANAEIAEGDTITSFSASLT